METAGTMAKKKMPPKTDPSRTRDEVIFIRVTGAYKDAVEAFAEWDRASSMAELFDDMLVSYARSKNYPGTFPKR